MTPPDENTDATTQTPGAVPRWLALALLGTALVAGFMAVGFASEAQDARAQADLLKDGVDRSSLPLDQAVEAFVAEAENLDREENSAER